MAAVERAGDEAESASLGVDEDTSVGAGGGGSSKLQDAESGARPGNLIGETIGRDNAGRGGPGLRLGVKNGDDRVAGVGVSGTGNGKYRQAGGGDADGGYVAALIEAEQFNAIENLARFEADLNSVGVFDQVPGGKQIAIGVDDEGGA